MVFLLLVMVMVILMRILNLGGINQLLADVCHSVATGLDQLESSSLMSYQLTHSKFRFHCTHLATLGHDESAALDQLTLQGSNSAGDRLHSLEQCVQDLLFQFQRIYCRLFALQNAHVNQRLTGRERLLGCSGQGLFNEWT